MSSEKFNQFLQAQSKVAMYSSLPDYLILPVQRVPRYRMLLESLLQYTSPYDPERAVIKKALDSVAVVADSINRAIREHQELEELIRIVRQIKNAPPNLVVPRRAFIQEGPLIKICRKSPKMRHFFLFSDCLVYTKRIETVNTMYMFHRMVMLSSSHVESVEDRKETKNAFQILGKEKSFTLCAKDPKEKQEWIDAISAAVSKLGNVGQKNQAPVWVPDGDSESCMLCKVKFTVVNRRHHCRRCGKVVCGKCSPCSFLLDNVGAVERVCCPCFDYLVEFRGGWSAVQSHPELYRIPPKQVSSIPCRVFTPPAQWNQNQVVEWFEQVCKGAFAEMGHVAGVPSDGKALLALTDRDAEALVNKTSAAGTPGRIDILAQFFEQLAMLRMQQTAITTAEPDPASLSRSKKFANSFRHFINSGSQPPDVLSPTSARQANTPRQSMPASRSQQSLPGTPRRSPYHVRSASALNMSDDHPPTPGPTADTTATTPSKDAQVQQQQQQQQQHQHSPSSAPVKRKPPSRPPPVLSPEEMEK